MTDPDANWIVITALFAFILAFGLATLLNRHIVHWPWRPKRWEDVQKEARRIMENE